MTSSRRTLLLAGLAVAAVGYGTSQGGGPGPGGFEASIVGPLTPFGEVAVAEPTPSVALTWIDE